MTAIKAEIIKEKGSKDIAYSFEVNNEAFEAHYSPGGKAIFSNREGWLQITCNGSELGTVFGKMDKGRKFEYVANSKAEPLKITAWIDDGFSFLGNFFGKLRGVGIEVNGIPVQHTLADPETYIKNGRFWLYVLLLILSIGSIHTYWYIFKEHSSHIVAGISSAIYFIPAIIVLIAVIKYNARTTFAIVSGIVISVLEMADYIPGVKTFTFAVYIFMVLRISILYALCNAFRWKLKQKKSNSFNKGGSQ